MAGSDSDSLDDMLLQAGGAGKASNKRSRSEDIFDDSGQDEAASDFSEEVSQAAQPRGVKPVSKRSKTADASSNKPDSDKPFNEDEFMFDGYGKTLIRDEADAERLDALNELDREMELSSRADLRDKELERMRNARLLLQAKSARAKQTEAAPPQVPQLCLLYSAHALPCSICSSLLRLMAGLARHLHIHEFFVPHILPAIVAVEKLCDTASVQNVRERSEAVKPAHDRGPSDRAVSDEAGSDKAASDKADQMRSSTRLKRPDSGKVDAMAELRARRAQAQERKSTKESAK